MSFSLDKLKIFYTVANRGSFTLAAQHLNISQSALSRSVASLEDQLRCQLFERSVKGLKLTEEGAFWYENASSMMSIIKEAQPETGYSKKKQELVLLVQNMVEQLMKEMAGEDKDVKGSRFSCTTIQKKKEDTMTPIKILAPDGLSTFILPEILAKISEETKDLAFNTESVTLDRDLGDADITILPCSPQQDNYRREKITDMRFNLYASPTYLEKKGCPQKISDLKNHTVIKLTRGDSYKVYGTKTYKPYNDSPSHTSTESNTALLKLGEAGLGIIVYADKIVNKVKPNLEKIPELDEEFAFPLHMNIHKRLERDSQTLTIAEKLLTRLKESLR